MPWLTVKNGIRWLHWPTYDEKAAHHFDDVTRYIRHYRQNWRYFRPGWGDDGVWKALFIDDDAKRRYRAREKRDRKKGATNES
jgi:hypothetical protein